MIDALFIEWNVTLSFSVFRVTCRADISKAKWETLMAANNWNAVELRDNRYNQIVHMVSAANGAEEFYSTEVGQSTPLGNHYENFIYSLITLVHIDYRYTCPLFVLTSVVSFSVELTKIPIKHTLSLQTRIKYVEKKWPRTVRRTK